MTERKKIAIIGGSGKMGRWSAGFLLKEGYRVVITGRNQKKLEDARKQFDVEIAAPADAVTQADVVLLSVSLGNFEEAVKEIAPHTRPGQVIIDNTSIKELPVEVMHRYIKSRLILGMHPMFGPGTEGISDQNFVLTPINKEEEDLAGKVHRFLEARGARVTLMSPHEHDEMMSVILGLSHFIGLVSADTLAGFERLEQMNAVSGTTFRLLLSLVKSVVFEDPEFYSSLQMALPGAATVHRLFRDKANEWAEMVAKKDQTGFADRMKALADRLNKLL
jgi:prephenate dehydrogenase